MNMAFFCYPAAEILLDILPANGGTLEQQQKISRFILGGCLAPLGVGVHIFLLTLKRIRLKCYSAGRTMQRKHAVNSLLSLAFTHAEYTSSFIHIF